MRRSGIKRKRPAPKDEELFAALRQRSEGHCEARINVACVGMANHVHHRKRKAVGGKDTVANCLMVCTMCHAQIHHYPKMSYQLGLLVHSWADPAEVKVRTYG